MAGRLAIRRFQVMDLRIPVNSRTLARLIAMVHIHEHPRFIAEAKEAPDLDTFQQVNMLTFMPNPYHRPDSVA
jgi:hypothetical protein